MVNRNLIVFLIALQAVLILTTFVYAEELTTYKKIIEKELDYPRDVLYSLTAQLPAANVSAQKNDEYLNIAKTLEKAGLIRLERKDNKTVLVPKENTKDVLQVVQDMQYKTIAINVILGLLSAEVNEFKKKGALIVVEGKSKFKPSRIYKDLSKALPKSTLDDCSAHSLVWEIDMAESGRKAVEKTK
jgi:hypothetical protein